MNFAVLFYLLLSIAYAEVKTLAVLDYRGEEVEQVILQKLSDQTRIAASSTLPKAEYQVLSRERLLSLLRAQESLRSCTGDGCDLEIGRVLAVDYIVTGNVLALDGEYFVTLQLQEPQTGLMLRGEDIEASSLGQLIKKSKSVSIRLFELGLELPSGLENQQENLDAGADEVGKPGVGPIFTYYRNWLTDVDFAKGKTIGLVIVNGGLGILTFLFLLVLAALVIRARPENSENRFMCVLLIAEG